MIRWWENGKLQDPIEDPIEKTYYIIGFGNNWRLNDGYIYILQEKISKGGVILCDNYSYYPNNYYEIIKPDDLDDYIFNNAMAIYVFHNNKRFEKFYWKDLPEYIKEQINTFN